MFQKFWQLTLQINLEPINTSKDIDFMDLKVRKKESLPVLRERVWSFVGCVLAEEEAGLAGWEELPKDIVSTTRSGSCIKIQVLTVPI